MLLLNRKIILAIVTGLLSLLVLCVVIWLGLPDGRLHIWFLDVGQGDSVLMRLPAGEFILTDGGPGDVVIQELSKIIPFYEHEIELVVLSHPHADHLDGLLHVLERYKVRNMLLTGVEYDYIGYSQLMKLAEEHGVNLLYPEPGMDLRIGKTGLDLIYPVTNFKGRSFLKLNNSSIVYRLVYGDFVALLSGDLEEEIEGELVRDAKLRLGADLMKAGHHGSKTSNTLDFVEAIKPKMAVISCGVDNKFKHPAAKTLETFRRVGVQVKRTDLDGTVGLVFGD